MSPATNRFTGRFEQPLRGVHLLQLAVPQHAHPFPSVIASTWSWVT